MSFGAYDQSDKITQKQRTSLIIVKINGGLGNQMFQYAAAKAVSLRNDTILKVDITEFKKQKIHNGYRLNLFNIDENIASKAEINTLKTSTNPFIRKLIRAGVLPRMKTWHSEKKGFKTKVDTDIFSHKELYLDGLFQTQEYFAHIKELLAKEFALKDALSVKAELYMRLIKNSDSVSVHVRRGDFINLGWCLELDYYKEAVKFISDRHPTSSFFVFSDDVKWCKEHLTFIQNPTFVEGAKNEAEDLELMKNCRHNIIPNSTFGWWAAWLNQNSDKIVIAPKQWLEDDKDFDPTHKSWVRL
jgi:hypothetical protein